MRRPRDACARCLTKCPRQNSGDSGRARWVGRPANFPLLDCSRSRRISEKSREAGEDQYRGRKRHRILNAGHCSVALHLKARAEAALLQNQRDNQRTERKAALFDRGP